jgi:hypothetical protein
MQFRRNTVTATSWENSSRRMDRRNAPETAPIEAPWPLRLKWMSVGSRIWSLRHWIWTPGGFAPLLEHWMHPKGFHQRNLPLYGSKRSSRQIKKWVGRFVRICSETLHATSNVCPKELRPKWLNESICKIPPSKSDDRWLNRSALAGSQMGWKETAIWIRVSCSSPNPQTSLRPHWLSCALCNGYS